MTSRSWLLVAGLVTSATLGLGACASRPPGAPTDAARTLALRPGTTEVAKGAQSLIGKSGHEVIAAFGPPAVIRFDSGYEVWVFRHEEPGESGQPRRSSGTPGPPRDRDRERDAAPASELVLLMPPSKIVAKVRVRSADR